MLSNETKLKLKKNDTVQVIAGREKGKSGKILKVDSKANTVLVEKLNLVKRHVKPTQKNPQGGITEKESPLHYSNVLIMCQKCQKGVRHGVQLVEKKGKKVKVRVCKRCKTSLDAA